MNWHQGDKLEIPIIGIVEFTGQLLGLLWFKLDERREIGLEAKTVNENLKRPTMWRRIGQYNGMTGDPRGSYTPDGSFRMD